MAFKRSSRYFSPWRTVFISPSLILLKMWAVISICSLILNTKVAVHCGLSTLLWMRSQLISGRVGPLWVDNMNMPWNNLGYVMSVISLPPTHCMHTIYVALQCLRYLFLISSVRVQAYCTTAAREEQRRKAHCTQAQITGYSLRIALFSDLTCHIEPCNCESGWCEHC